MSQDAFARYVGCHKSQVIMIECVRWASVSRRIVRKVLSLDENVKLDIPFDRMVPYRDRTNPIEREI